MKLIELQIYKNNANFKWHIIFVFLPLFLLTIFFSSSCAQEATTKTKEDAFQVLGEEQSMAESYMYLLNEFGKKDLNKYGKGIQLYVNARAKFNGLIELMKHKLSEGEPFDNSPDFDNTLKTAVDKRVSFTTYINEEIIGDSEGKKGFPVAIIGGAAELIKALTEVGKTIWQEYRSVNDTRRKELLEQLEALKWKAFHEIGGEE